MSQTPEQPETVSVPPADLIEGYSALCAQMTHRALIAEAGVEMLRKQVGELQQVVMELREKHDDAPQPPSA